MADFIKNVGKLATDRYQFQDHVDGTTLKHNADAITVTPPLTLDLLPRSNVYSALQAIGSELDNLELSGKGFITVGDGYDTYHNSLATPDTPYDAAIPAFNTYLNDVLNNSANSLYFRIRAGGVVLIKAGTYKITGTVNVPAGIILLGEGYGTKLVNQMSSPTPLFKIKADTTRVPDGGIDSTETFIFNKETAFINLTIADNFLEPKFLGDLSYKTPINNNSVQPLVALEEGASLSCENVKFVGKTTYTLGVVSSLTSFAIKVDSTTPISTGTRLKIFNCSIDGFSIPLQFTASGIKNDHFIMSNSLVRGYGFLNSDFVSASNNTIIKLNACNANVNNNYCFGYDNTVTSLAYITPSGSAPVLQAIPKLTFHCNNIAVKRTSSAENTTFDLIKYSTTLNNDLYVIALGNNFNGVPQIDSGLRVKTRVVNTATYTVDSISKDYLLFVDTTSTAITINLPTHKEGRELIIKDYKGNSGLNNITLVRNGGTGSIEDAAADKIVSLNWVSITLVSDGINWLTI